MIPYYSKIMYKGLSNFTETTSQKISLIFCSKVHSFRDILFQTYHLIETCPGDGKQLFGNKYFYASSAMILLHFFFYVFPNHNTDSHIPEMKFIQIQKLIIKA